MNPSHIMQADDGLVSNYFVGYMGIASALVLSAWGAVYGTARSSAAIFDLGVEKPLVMKSFVPIIMSGVLAIYGLILAVILTQKSKMYINTSSKLGI